jgi:hypothetical protein
MSQLVTSIAIDHSRAVAAGAAVGDAMFVSAGEGLAKLGHLNRTQDARAGGSDGDDLRRRRWRGGEQQGGGEDHAAWLIHFAELCRMV